MWLEHAHTHIGLAWGGKRPGTRTNMDAGDAMRMCALCYTTRPEAVHISCYAFDLLLFAIYARKTRVRVDVATQDDAERANGTNTSYIHTCTMYVYNTHFAEDHLEIITHVCGVRYLIDANIEHVRGERVMCSQKQVYI